MKWILLALPAFAAACSTGYQSCHCYNQNGMPDNEATQSICNEKWGEMRLNTREYPNYIPGYFECSVTDNSTEWTWDNCNWRKECEKAGATGLDSSCFAS